MGVTAEYSLAVSRNAALDANRRYSPKYICLTSANEWLWKFVVNNYTPVETSPDLNFRGIFI